MQGFWVASLGVLSSVTMRQINLRLSEEMLAGVELARGTVAREAWLRGVVGAVLGPAPVVTTQAASAPVVTTQAASAPGGREGAPADM